MDKKTKIHRLGETKIMKNGMSAKIIKYDNAHSIDIEFEDGTIIYNQDYKLFKTGSTVNPNFTPHIGETNTMISGMKATIIAYRRYSDIDVKFEDGTIVTNKRYSAFIEGHIGNPNFNKHPKRKRTERIGESLQMKCGDIATIITYRNRGDIDVQFTNGYISRHKHYNSFLKGEITNNPIKCHINETNKMHCGLMATIINQHSYDDIDIEFEDKSLVKHKDYNSFKSGYIKYPKFKSNEIINNHIILNKINMQYYLVSTPDKQEIIMSVPEIQQLEKMEETS